METSDQLSFHKSFPRDSCRPGPEALHRWVIHAAGAADLDIEGDEWEQFTLSQPLHGRAEGGTIGNARFRGYFHQNSQFRKRTLSLRKEKDKTEIPFSRQADHSPLRKPFGSAPAARGLVWPGVYDTCWY